MWGECSKAGLHCAILWAKSQSLRGECCVGWLHHGREQAPEHALGQDHCHMCLLVSRASIFLFPCVVHASVCCLRPLFVCIMVFMSGLCVFAHCHVAERPPPSPFQVECAMPRAGTRYRYVFHCAGGYYAQAHGWKSRLMPTADAAAAALGRKLDIPPNTLLKVLCETLFRIEPRKPNAIHCLSCCVLHVSSHHHHARLIYYLLQGAEAVSKVTGIAGVYWHAAKLGWVSKSGRKGAHFTAAAAAASSADKTSMAPRRRWLQRASGARRSRFHHVVFHSAKQAAMCCVCMGYMYHISIPGAEQAAIAVCVCVCVCVCVSVLSRPTLRSTRGGSSGACTPRTPRQRQL